MIDVIEKYLTGMGLDEIQKRYWNHYWKFKIIKE
jgi:hypothetical protein